MRNLYSLSHQLEIIDIISNIIQYEQLQLEKQKEEREKKLRRPLSQRLNESQEEDDDRDLENDLVESEIEDKNKVSDFNRAAFQIAIN